VAAALRPARLPAVPSRATLASVETHPSHAIAASGRSFATFRAPVVVPIVNRREELLLLESERRRGLCEPVNGAVDIGETLLRLRKIAERGASLLWMRNGNVPGLAGYFATSGRSPTSSARRRATPGNRSGNDIPAATARTRPNRAPRP